MLSHLSSSRWSRNSRCRWLEALSASNAAAASTNTAWPHSNGWLQLIRNSQSLNNVRIPPVPSEPQAQREQQNNRATLLVHQGELSAARQVLTSAGLAPGSEETLTELRDSQRRPEHMHMPLSDHVIDFNPPSQLKLRKSLLLGNLRRARRGAAPGPSGITAEHI